ncbi:MAG: RluA family pseudouridine synthase [Geobacteraceae bacterium]
MLTYTIDKTDHCRSVESFLRNLLPPATMGHLHKLLKNGHVKINGDTAQPGCMLLLDDCLTLKESNKTASLLRAKVERLDILYEDDLVLIVNKELGLPVHKSAEEGARNLVEVAERHLAMREIICKPRPVNRIDKGTSGAVILAKSSTVAGIFGRYIMENGLGKVYLAAVAGRLAAEGTIDNSIDGKESLTRYRLLAEGKMGSIVAVYPVTGRLHQIRRHLAAVGCPILGDKRYGGPPIGGYIGHGLHAFATSFRHPESCVDIIVYAPLPGAFLQLLERIAPDYFPVVLKQLPTLSWFGGTAHP